jgi:LuxR family maltose regulon positive regulatory protein
MALSPGECAPEYIFKRHLSILEAHDSPLGRLACLGQGLLDLQLRPEILDEARAIAESCPLALIIDDFHLASDHRYVEFLERLARARIPGLSFLVLSRSRPQMPVEELRVKGLIKYYCSDLLALDLDEVEAYLRLCGIDGDNLAPAVLKSSEGWAAALRLHAEEYLRSGQLARDHVFHNFFGSSVLSGAPAGLRGLLASISVLETFTAQEAVAVSNDPRAGTRLTRFIDQGGFATFDHKTGTLRLHNLFRSFCRSSLDPGPDRPGVLRRAAETLLTRGERGAAARTLTEAGRGEDWARLLGLYEDRAFQLECQCQSKCQRLGGFEPVEIMSRAPLSAIGQRPLGYLSLAFAAALRLGSEPGLELIKSAEKVLIEACGEKSLPEIVRSALSYAAFVMSFSDIAGGLKGLAGVPPAATPRGVGLACGFHWTLGSPHAGFLHHREPGGYQNLVSAVEGHWRAFEGLCGGWGSGGLSLMKAELALETGNFERALDLAERAQAEAECHHQDDIALAAALVTLRAYQARKAPAKAQELLRALPASDGGPDGLWNAAAIIKAYVSFNFGQPQDLEQWGRDWPLDTMPPWTRHGTLFGLIVHARALALRRENSALLNLTGRLEAAFGARRSVLGLVHTLTLEAIARWIRDGAEAGLSAFRKAVQLAAPDRLILIPAEYGRLIIPLTVLAQADPALASFRPYLGEVLELARVFDSLTQAPQSDPAGPRQLTARERNFLDQVVLGLSNQQIAELYNVKCVTVTKALSNAYRKLGAKNRSQAVHHLLNGG